MTQAPKKNEWRALTRQEILEAPSDIEHEFVPTPELTKDHDPKAGVWVRGLTVDERDNFENSLVKEKRNKQSMDLRDVRSKLIILACEDGPGGERLFTQEDIAMIRKRSARVFDRIASMAQTLAGIGDDDLEEMRADLGTAP